MRDEGEGERVQRGREGGRKIFLLFASEWGVEQGRQLVEHISSIYVQTVGPFVPRLGIGLDGHLGGKIGYKNNSNTPYNREPLSSMHVQTVGPFVPRLGMGLDGHLGVK